MKTKIIFICHGNICRSTMAEFLFRDMVEKQGVADRFAVISRATSTEELGNPVHPGTRQVLSRLGISTTGKYAQRITREECDAWDMLIVMDRNNRRNLTPFIGNNAHKVTTLLSYAGLDRDISDPWYTGNFEDTYQDVKMGCEALLKKLLKE
ncbi:MAG: low molecular weight phosphotyrosine protein phosphatase [Clostridia bacterium]|nr:low molecular weight phosphotyrosine protein phosphatase [Clostridia bacterium]